MCAHKYKFITELAFRWVYTQGNRQSPLRQSTQIDQNMTSNQNHENNVTSIKDAIIGMLTNVIAYYSNKTDDGLISPVRKFTPSKSLTEKDEILIAMLNSQGHEHICFCICDPDLEDNPIIFVSDGFCNFTGYSHDEIEGRNCRFLQGEGTSKEDVDLIRKALKEETETNVNLLNYRKDGTPFVNQFFLAPLHSDDPADTVSYYIGVQSCVPKMGPGQMPANLG